MFKRLYCRQCTVSVSVVVGKKYWVIADNEDWATAARACEDKYRPFNGRLAVIRNAEEQSALVSYLSNLHC